MRGGSKSETITENIFREFYGNGAFIEKSAIPSHYGFKSKKGTGYKGYPDFFRDNANEDFVIIVEAKADDYIIRKSKCSTDFKRNDFLKKNEAYPLGALRSLKFAYRKLRISLFVELAV